MREHHPMRYHRMTEILKSLASIKLSSLFLIKVWCITRKHNVTLIFELELLLKKPNADIVGFILLECIRHELHCLLLRAHVRHLYGILRCYVDGWGYHYKFGIW